MEAKKYQEFTTRIDEVRQNESKKALDLSGLGLTIIPTELGKIPHLEWLDLSNNNIQYFSLNHVNDKIRGLNLDNNNIKEIPHSIADFKHLEHLSIDNNLLKALPSSIGYLKNLKTLKFGDNNLAYLPASILNLKNCYKSIISSSSKGNHFSLPPEILNQGYDKIIQYLLSENRVKLNEAKVILLGDANAGKTAIVNRLINDVFHEHTPMTKGIEINDYSIKIEENNEIKANIWDFGGQEILRSMHQFFMSERTLYILVWNARNDDPDGRIEDWLQLINSFGGESPIIIVINQIDDGPFTLDKRALSNKYRTLKSIVRTSCKTRVGINELKSVIRKNIPELSHLKDKIPQRWLDVKERVENQKSNYLEYSKYRNICRDCGVEYHKEQDSLIQLLNDLGIAFNHVQSTTILKPEWITNAIYSLINSNKLFMAFGKLRLSDLGAILDQEVYPIEKHEVIIDIMEKFELCFAIENEEKSPIGIKSNRIDKTYLLPDLLSVEIPPNITFKPRDSLQIKYKYSYLPKSIIPKIIVKLNYKSASSGSYWRSGILIKEEQNFINIYADQKEKLINIIVTGELKTRKKALNLVSSIFDQIHASIRGLKSELLVPLPDQPEFSVNYYHLLTLEVRGINEFIPENLPKNKKRKYNVKSLLNGIQNPKDREFQISTETDLEVIRYLINQKSEEFEVLKKSKYMIDNESERWASRYQLMHKLLIAGYAALLLTIHSFIGWDRFEPLYSFVFPLGGLVIIAVFPFLRNLVFNPKELKDKIQTKKQESMYVKYGLKIDKYNTLKNDLEELRKREKYLSGGYNV